MCLAICVSEPKKFICALAPPLSLWSSSSELSERLSPSLQWRYSGNITELKALTLCIFSNQQILLHISKRTPQVWLPSTRCSLNPVIQGFYGFCWLNPQLWAVSWTRSLSPVSGWGAEAEVQPFTVLAPSGNQPASSQSHLMGTSSGALITNKERCNSQTCAQGFRRVLEALCEELVWTPNTYFLWYHVKGCVSVCVCARTCVCGEVDIRRKKRKAAREEGGRGRKLFPFSYSKWVGGMGPEGKAGSPLTWSLHCWGLWPRGSREPKSQLSWRGVHGYHLGGLGGRRFMSSKAALALQRPSFLS